MSRNNTRPLAISISEDAPISVPAPSTAVPISRPVVPAVPVSGCEISVRHRSAQSPACGRKGLGTFPYRHHLWPRRWCAEFRRKSIFSPPSRASAQTSKPTLPASDIRASRAVANWDKRPGQTLSIPYRNLQRKRDGDLPDPFGTVIVWKWSTALQQP